jgi:hypothetical protein
MNKSKNKFPFQVVEMLFKEEGEGEGEGEGQTENKIK